MVASIRVALVLALVVSCAACGGLRGGRIGWDSGSGINYFFLGGEPYDFTGPDAANTDLREAAAALLTDRTVDFHPDLGIALSPKYEDRTALTSTVAYSQIGHYGVLIPGLRHEGSQTAYNGDVVYGSSGDPGALIFRFIRDLTLAPATPTVEYSFDYARTTEMIDSIKEWRGTINQHKISEDTQTVEVIVRGEQDGAGWELRCKQDVACVAYWYMYE